MSQTHSVAPCTWAPCLSSRSASRDTSWTSFQTSCLRSRRLSAGPAPFRPHRPMQLFPLMMGDLTNTHTYAHITLSRAHSRAHSRFCILRKAEESVNAPGRAVSCFWLLRRIEKIQFVLIYLCYINAYLISTFNLSILCIWRVTSKDFDVHLCLQSPLCHYFQCLTFMIPDLGGSNMVRSSKIVIYGEHLRIVWINNLLWQALNQAP